MQLAVEFLTGRVVATNPDREDGVDWPIGPGRLFAALAAAAFHLPPSQRPQAHSWLRWLETQAPPRIYACEPQRVTVAQTYGVRNASNVPFMYAAKHPAEDVVFLREMPLLDSVMYFVYDSALPEEYREIATVTCANVTYVGASESLALVRLSDDPIPDTLACYAPNSDGEITIEQPYAGRLHDLEAAYAFFMRPERRNYEGRGIPAGLVVPYARRHEDPTTAYRTILPLAFLQAEGRVGPMRDLLDGSALVDLARKAFLSKLPTGASPVLTGHNADGERFAGEHVAFIPLADVGIPHGTGVVRGVGLVLPRELSELDEAIARQAWDLGRLQFDNVWWPVGPRTLLSRPYRALEPRRYGAPSRIWRSVTPIVFNVPPRRGRPLVDILTRMLTEIDVDVPLVEVRSGAHPLVSGALHVRDHGLPMHQAFHLKLTFAAPLRGPLLIGRKRFAGLGLCLPQPEDDDAKTRV
ncbi:MAG: type I-G CRISPR-associated protein Csb2 [Vulcanimicrobiaceae bacterium]